MAEKTEYAELTVDELKAELEKRELPKSGKKAELITRLEDDDTAQGGTAPENEAVPATEEAVSESDTKSDSAEASKPKRRGSEVSAGAKRRDKSETAGEAPRDKAGAVAVRAQARFVRSAPRKARLVMDHIRGKEVAEARAILRHTTRSAATDIAKLLESAVANAENNFELDPEELKIGTAFVDEGPTIKRFRPRAQGRATPIHKRTSHMTITLTTTGKDA
jgi:large subunit ribosomal protein L22